MAKKNKKKEESILEKKVKIMKIEAEKREKTVITLPVEIEVEFGTWFYSRSSKIPAGHLKEIIWADFKARGLKEKEKASKYDEALKVYGIR